MALRLEETDLVELVSDRGLLSLWRDLAIGLRDSSYFLTPDWVVPWWRTVGTETSGPVALVWDGDVLAGLMALARVRRPITRRIPWTFSATTNAGAGVGSDHLGWLAKGQADAVLAAWAPRHSPLLLNAVPPSIGEALGGRLLEQQHCPRVEINDVAGSMSKKLAKNLRNARRRLDEAGVAFDWKTPGEVSREDLEDLYDLHRWRRIQAGEKPVFDDALRRGFHDALLESPQELAAGTAVLRALLGEQVVGVLYGFVWQKTFSYYQIGWEESFARFSLGSVLVLNAIEACEASGMETFDFLRGRDPYKYRFGAKDVVEGNYAIGWSPGLAAYSALARARGRSLGRRIDT